MAQQSLMQAQRGIISVLAKSTSASSTLTPAIADIRQIAALIHKQSLALQGYWKTGAA